MQIASGWSKGLKLATPPGEETRPTRERVRSASLNMLQPWISEAQVLDLFAGSGAVGLELLSRGARGAVFLEQSKPAVKVLTLNVKGLMDRAIKQQRDVSPCQVLEGDVWKKLVGLPDGAFDLIWADPPYRMAADFLTLMKSHLGRLLREDGVFAFECGNQDQSITQDFSSVIKTEPCKQRSYGVTLITIWQKPSH